MTKPLFQPMVGGRIVSTATGETVLTVNLDKVLWCDANRIIHACLRALEDEFGGNKTS